MFKHVVFKYKNNFICTYILKENYQIILSLCLFYNKFDTKNLLNFNKFLNKSVSLHWFRVSFRGKGYRLRKFKKHNKLTLNFGHSHWARIALDRDVYFFKKLRRQNYLCFVKGYSFYKEMRFGFKFFKKLNTYTKRGLRLRKQFIKKRFGKISQVVSSLH